jgi:hypothetical protein
MTKDEIVLSRLEEKIDNLVTKVDDINKKLYGNGNPGIIIDQKSQDGEINRLLLIANKNELSIAKLENITSDKWIGKNWIKIVMIATLFFIVLHSFLPAEFTIWQLLSLIK